MQVFLKNVIALKNFQRVLNNFMKFVQREGHFAKKATHS